MEAEVVDIFASFTKEGPRPQLIRHKGHSYRINRVNLHYTAREGGRVVHYFACSDDANYFQLRFDPVELRWQLMQIEDYTEPTS